MALISCIFLFFCKHAKLAARGRTRVRATKNPARHAARGFWRSFDEYAFLEDSRYASQAKNGLAVKSLNSRRMSAFS
jgi:hypothetical protein